MKYIRHDVEAIIVWYIVNEAHENSTTEKHKYLSDSNPIYLPTNLVIAQGTAISFLDADAPWDTPHPHTINIVDSSGNSIWHRKNGLYQ